MARYLSGRPVNLTHTFLDDETELSPAEVTVTVTRVGASSYTVQGPATKTDTTYGLSAGLLPEGAYLVRWDGSTVVDVETVEVVGGFLFSIPEARASDEGLTVDRFPTGEIRHYRDVVEAEFQRITGRSFTPRTMFLSRDQFPDCTELLPACDVRSVTVLGPSPGPVAVDRIGHYALMPEVPADATGVEVAYGFTTVPEDIKRVGMLYLRYLLTAERSGIPDRATSYQPETGGTYTLATPGRAGYETGIPDVDAVLEDYQYKIVQSVVLG